MVLLCTHLHGLDTEQLATALSDEGVDAVTVRAEISRLRRDLGAHVVQSRPYRLRVPVDSDLDRITERLRRGDPAGAITVLGGGGLLAASRAPGVVEVFEEILSDIRSAVVASSDRTALRSWTDSVHGRDDAAAWGLLADSLPRTQTVHAP